MAKTFNLRTLEDDATKDPAFTAGVIVALATGNPRMMEYIEVEAKSQLLSQILAGYERELAQYTNINQRVTNDSSIPFLEEEISRLESRLEVYRRDEALARRNLDDCTGKNFSVWLRDIEFTDRQAANDGLWAMIEAAMLAREPGEIYSRGKFGTYGGFDLWVVTKTVNNTGEVTGTLRYPDTDYYREYSEFTDFRIVKDAGVTTTRLEERFKAIITRADDTLKIIQRSQSKLAEARKSAASIEARIAEIRREINENKLIKMTMEEELGLNKAEEEMAAVDLENEDDH